MPLSTVELDSVLLGRVTVPGAAPGPDTYAVIAAAVCAALYRYDRAESRTIVVDRADGAAAVAACVELSAGQPFQELTAAVQSALAAGRGSGAGIGSTGEKVTLRLLLRLDASAELTVDADRLPHDGGPSWVDSFTCLLDDGLARPRTRIGALRMNSDAEAHALADAQNEWAAAYRPPDADLLHVPFERMAVDHPGRAAVVTDTETVSYGELNSRADRYADLLRARGCGPERTVGVYVDRSVDLVVALLAVLKSGAAFIPLDRRLPVDRIATMLDDAGCSLIVSQDHLLPALVGLGIRVLTESADRAGASSGGRVPLRSQNSAFLYYTSGSTGTPKGVVIDHRNAAARVAWIARHYGFQVGDVALHKTPLIFDVAVIEIFAPLGVGATVRIAAPGGEADLAYLTDLLAADDIAFVHFVPSMLKTLLAGADRGVFPGVHRLQTSGEAMPARLLARTASVFPNARFDSAYGQTESSEVAVWEVTGASAGGGLVPLGEPVAGYRLFVLDEDLRPVPPGVPGEICVAAVGGLARGYHRRAAETAARFVPNPYPLQPGERLYRTGDLAVRPALGKPLEFLGRADHQAKIRGARVEVSEIEAVLAAAPQVEDCVVLVRDDAQGDAELVAYLVGGDMSVSALTEWLSRTLPEYMIPSAFVVVPQLPYTGSGKLDRSALPAPSAAERAARSRGEAPATPLEAELAAEWGRILEIESVGCSDGFFEIGGNSLKAAQMLGRVSSLFGIRIPAASFFRDPTVQGVAAEVERLVLESVSTMSDDAVRLQVADQEVGNG